MEGDGGRCAVRRIAVLLEYDGTAYRGSQYQDNGPSIQSELEAAVTKLTGATVRAAFAGRTDAGVHALGQVAAFDSEAALTREEFQSGLNHFLPQDIAVRAVQEVDETFDPRRRARNRLYRYRFDTRRVRSPLLRQRAWHVGRALDVAAMRRAAQALEGEYDFAAFAAPYEKSTVRTLRRCEVIEDGALLALEMEAQSFLPHQVRRTAGPLVAVGLGRINEDDIATLLAEARPSSAGPAAPPHGLYLVKIEYDGLTFESGGEDGTGTWGPTY